MNTSLDPFDDSVEAQLACLQPSVAVDGLREATLAQVRRELRASGWDRRLGRVAMVLLVLGIGMNVATIDKPSATPDEGQLAARPSIETTTESIVALAVTMAEVTDIHTASIFARHLAVFNGFPLGSEQAEAIEQEIDRLLTPAVSNGKEG
jgi:hypothetical protein